MRILPSALKRVDQGVTKVAIRHVSDNAVSLVTTDDGLLIIGPDPAGRLLELLGERRNGAMAQWRNGQLIIFHAMPSRAKNRRYLA